ncbi:RBBP9/YdeN family alpha/beta hydrolase [Ideonella sp.]|uniref:RBBP9/YdeN family alpha/beta hydrolase n=1 Tax=Ideonella sp. TaxID=1929293 RepID=UPI0035ADC0A6
MNLTNDDVRVLLLPGWLDSGPGHWQTRWEERHGDTRVQQADWQWPRRGDWMARLDEVLLDDARPALLAAHSLGCHLVAAWAAHSQHTGRVRGALLVAPPDLGRADTPPQLRGWWPPVAAALPFPARVVWSDDDPFCAPPQAQWLAQAWGAPASAIGARGHINAESGLGEWPEGRAMLLALAPAPVADKP